MNNTLTTAKFWQFDAKSVFPFGKYKGKAVIKVFEEDPSYIGFCLRNIAKFTLTVTGWNSFGELNPGYFNQKGNNDLFEIFVNKSREINRILRQNTHADDMRDRPSDYFAKKIIFFNEADPIVRTKFKREKKSIANEHGKVINISQIHHYLGMPDKNPSNDELNIINFKIRIVDIKDLAIFSKYDSDYGKSNFRVFEILRTLPCGRVYLIVTMDLTNFREQTRLFSNEPLIKILPDDSDCILHVINYYFTKDERIGERDMTQEEIDSAVITEKKRQEELQTIANKKQLNKDKLKKDNFSWLEEEEEEEEEDNSASKNTNTRKVPLYGPVNKLEETLAMYSLNRKAFPNANLLRTTSLQYYAHTLQFSIHTDLLDELTKKWHEENNNLKEYEFKVERGRKKYSAYIRSQNHESDDSDDERDAWEELTDGQNGTWEDWHDPTPID